MHIVVFQLAQLRGGKAKALGRFHHLPASGFGRQIRSHQKAGGACRIREKQKHIIAVINVGQFVNGVFLDLIDGGLKQPGIFILVTQKLSQAEIGRFLRGVLVGVQDHSLQAHFLERGAQKIQFRFVVHGDPSLFYDGNWQ